MYLSSVKPVIIHKVDVQNKKYNDLYVMHNAGSCISIYT